MKTIKVKYSECLKDIESAKGFIELNKIIPSEVIVLWYEEELKEKKE
jgi:hypothetical protein